MKSLKLGPKRKGVKLERQTRLAEPYLRIERIIFRTADKGDRYKAVAELLRVLENEVKKRGFERSQSVSHMKGA